MLETLIPVGVYLGLDWLYRYHKGTRELIQKAARATFGQATRALPGASKEALRSIYRRLFDGAAQAAGIRWPGVSKMADDMFEALWEIHAREQWDNAMMELVKSGRRAEKFIDGLQKESFRAPPGVPL